MDERPASCKVCTQPQDAVVHRTVRRPNPADSGYTVEPMGHAFICDYCGGLDEHASRCTELRTTECPPIEGPVLVIAPHPDDDAIGVGGTLYLLALHGVEVRVLYLTSGELGCPGVDPAVVLEWRERDARRAANELYVPEPDFWEWADGGLRGRLDDPQQGPASVARLAEYVSEHGYRTILVPHGLESHPDHAAAYDLVLAAHESNHASMVGIEVMTYEVWTPMQRFTLAVDITTAQYDKAKAIRAHESQVQRMQFDAAALALNRYRGIMHNRPHGEYAEVFGTLYA